MAVEVWAASADFLLATFVAPLFRMEQACGFAALLPERQVVQSQHGPTYRRTVTDGTCVWTAIAVVYDELLKLAPSAVIELFELRLDSTLHGSSDVYRWHAGMSRNDRNQEVNVVFNGNEYTRLPDQG